MRQAGTDAEMKCVCGGTGNGRDWNQLHARNTQQGMTVEIFGPMMVLSSKTFTHGLHLIGDNCTTSDGFTLSLMSDECTNRIGYN